MEQGLGFSHWTGLTVHKKTFFPSANVNYSAFSHQYHWIISEICCNPACFLSLHAHLSVIFTFFSSEISLNVNAGVSTSQRLESKGAAS